MSPEIKTQFYSNVGILSTRFAISEQLVQEILCLSISNTTDDTITLTMIEEMSLWKKLDLLKKVIKINSGWENELSKMIKRLDKVRIERNLFIHGLWKDPVQNGNDITITVETKKIKFEEDKPDPKLVKDGYPHSYGTRSWYFNHFKTYTLKEIENIVKEINAIIITQEEIIKEIKEKLEL